MMPSENARFHWYIRMAQPFVPTQTEQQNASKRIKSRSLCHPNATQGDALRKRPKSRN
jgi:hypothetical protein